MEGAYGRGIVECFAACRPGLEGLVARQLDRLGIPPLEAVGGGVEFAGEHKELAVANLELGAASHILVRVGRFEARHLSTLVRKAKTLPWERLLASDAELEFRVTTRRSRLFHTGAIAERIREGIELRLGRGISQDAVHGARLCVVARLDRDACELSIDTSGEPLHRRGWRLESAKAPLREDLAHALLTASGWDARSSLIDPMMGSGTLVIEAACMARRLAPGRLRKFALESMPFFDTAAIEEARAQASARSLETLPFLIWGRDRNQRAVDAALRNAERAGVRRNLELECLDVRSCELPPVAALVCNPPYGQRVGAQSDLSPVYRALGAAVSKLEGRPRVGLVTIDRSLANACALGLRPALLTDHGGMKVEFFTNHGI